jgi:hypothetical protein
MHRCRSEIFNRGTAHDFGGASIEGKHLGLPLQGDSGAAAHEV